MAIVSLREMLEDARRGRYAVPLFDTLNMGMIRAAVEVAEEEDSPMPNLPTRPMIPSSM